MPKELLVITSGLRWLRTTIRPVGGWLQTELVFDVDGRALSLVIDTLPDRAFLLGATTIRNLSVHEATESERAFSGACRYRVRFIACEPPAEHEAFGSYVRYGPMGAV